MKNLPHSMDSLNYPLSTVLLVHEEIVSLGRYGTRLEWIVLQHIIIKTYIRAHITYPT